MPETLKTADVAALAKEAGDPKQRLSRLAVSIPGSDILKIAYEIVDVGSATVLTKGHTIQVAVHEATEELQFVSPPVVFDKLEKAWSR